MTLELIPNNDLIFKGPFNVVCTTTLKLANSGNERLAYKIKTTAPKRYCVKPNSGFLEARATTNVQVMLQPQVPGQTDDRTKHKFMVQWVAVPSGYTDDVDNFWKQDMKTLNVQDSKLKCVFADEQAPAVVPNDSHRTRDTDTSSPRHTDSNNLAEHRVQPTVASNPSTTSTSRSPAKNFGQTSSQDRAQNEAEDLIRSRLQQDIKDYKNKIDALENELKQMESGLRQRTTGGYSSASPTKPNQNQQQQSGLVIFGIALTEQLVLVAFLLALLFGFSLGYFLFSCSN